MHHHDSRGGSPRLAKEMVLVCDPYIRSDLNSVHDISPRATALAVPIVRLEQVPVYPRQSPPRHAIGGGLAGGLLAPVQSSAAIHAMPRLLPLVAGTGRAKRTTGRVARMIATRACGDAEAPA